LFVVIPFVPMTSDKMTLFLAIIVRHLVKTRKLRQVSTS